MISTFDYMEKYGEADIMGWDPGTTTYKEKHFCPVCGEEVELEEAHIERVSYADLWYHKDCYAEEYAS